MDWLRRPVKGSLLTELMKAAVAPQSKSRVFSDSNGSEEDRGPKIEV
jgi:hypothetical protein